MNIGLYARVSTDDQRDAKSIQTQLDVARRRATIEGWTLREFLDDGVSGTIPFGQRPGGRALLAAARSHEIDAVATYSLDRIGRRQIVILEAVRDIRATGATFFSLTETFEVGAFGDAALGMVSVFAQFARDQLVARTTEGLRRAAREGRFTGGRVPYGYRIEAGAIVVDEPAAAVVRDVHALAASGSSLLRITDELRRRGVSSYEGNGHWSTAMVWRLLRRECYLGTWTWGGIPRELPPIVSEAERAQALATLATNRRWGRAHAKRSYALRGLLHCACGVSMTGLSYFTTPEKTSPRVAYRCEKHRGDQLPGYVRESVLEEALWQKAVELLANPSALLTRILGRRSPEAREREIERELATTAAALTEIQAKEARLVDQALAEMFGRDVIAAKAQALRDQREGIERRLTDLRAEREGLTKRVAGVHALRTRILALAESAARADSQTRAKVLRLMVREVVVDRQEGRLSLRVRWAVHGDVSIAFASEAWPESAWSIETIIRLEQRLMGRPRS